MCDEKDERIEKGENLQDALRQFDEWCKSDLMTDLREMMGMNGLCGEDDCPEKSR